MPEELEPEFSVEAAAEEMIDEFGGLMDWNQRMQRGAARSARRLIRMADNYDIMGERCRDLATVLIVTAQQLSDQATDLLVAEFDVQVVKTNPEDEEEE